MVEEAIVASDNQWSGLIEEGARTIVSSDLELVTA